MKPAEPAVRDPPRDPARADSGGGEIRGRHDPVLATGQRAQRPTFVHLASVADHFRTKIAGR